MKIVAGFWLCSWLERSGGKLIVLAGSSKFGKHKDMAGNSNIYSTWQEHFPSTWSFFFPPFCQMASSSFAPIRSQAAAATPTRNTGAVEGQKY
jgi:hypothetical protein